MITGTLSLEWAVLSVPGVGTPITGELVLEWAVLDTDPTVGAVTGTLPVSWRIWGTATLQFVLIDAPTGIAGVLTIAIKIDDGLGTLLYGPTTQAIAESPPASGRYVATVPHPGAGSYFIVWTYGTSVVTVPLLIELVDSAFVRTFLNRTPPARADGLPWTTVEILEGATRRGPYLVLESIMLDPVDDDPLDPMARDVSTVDAVITAGWYALAWTDAAGSQSMTNPEYITSVIETT